MAKNIVVVAHKFVTQPDDDLVIFLNSGKCLNVLHIRHSFSDAPDRGSYYTWYKEGKVYKEKETRDFRALPEPAVYLKEFFFTIKWLLGSKIVWDTYVGMDGLCAFFGLTARFLGRVKRTVFWAIDFVPQNRFESGLKTKIYHFVNIIGYKNADEMWDLSPRMVEAREKFLGVKKSDYRKHKIVPYGVWVDRIRKYSYNECEKNTLVFMGHLLPKQGVQLVMRALPEIVKKIPDFRFKIIGDGSYRTGLETLAKELGVEKYCYFLGKIESDRKLEEEIAKSCVAIAPYIKKLDTWTYYADSGKVKKYLACGVPVLLTDLPWNAKEISAAGCGEIISEDVDDIAKEVVLLMFSDENRGYRTRAQKYARSFNYINIFTGLNL